MPLRLLMSNILSLKTRIPLDHFPKTFREAVEAARRMGINYLWIDSLCIIQDSNGDWLKESVLMYQVYSNAFINIAATGAHAGNKGLFFERDLPPVGACQVQVD